LRYTAFNRDGGVPRSVLILTLLLLVAGGALFLSQQKDSNPDFTLGGSLFSVATGEIEGILVTRKGAQFRLDRVDDEDWTLTGAVSDYVDTRAIRKFLDILVLASGGPLLPGTEVEDRRYEFNGPEAIRLTVFVTGADPISLVLGAANPVMGNFYASGAGRPACFLAPASLRKALSDLPGEVQAKKLLPGVTREKVDEIEIRRGGWDHQVKRRAGRWWIMVPPGGPAGLGNEVLDYQAMYGDRRESDDEGAWILASSAAVNKLIYEVSDIIVREIKSPAESAAVVEDWHLDPPWRRVTLRGPGLNYDPNADSPDKMVIAFGPAITMDTVPALRRGNVVVTDLEALNVLEQPIGILAHRTALTYLALKSDSLALEREGRLVLRGSRTGVAVTSEGRKAWLTEYPEAGFAGLKEVDRHGFIQDLAVSLDRIAVLAVLPPTDDAAILQSKERVKVTVIFGTGDDIRREIIEFGFLAEDHLPLGSPPLIRDDTGTRPVGLWFPESGKLLQVPPHFIVTARNLANMIQASSSP